MRLFRLLVFSLYQQDVLACLSRLSSSILDQRATPTVSKEGNVVIPLGFPECTGKINHERMEQFEISGSRRKIEHIYLGTFSRFPISTTTTTEGWIGIVTQQIYNKNL